MGNRASAALQKRVPVSFFGAVSPQPLHATAQATDVCLAFLTGGNADSTSLVWMAIKLSDCGVDGFCTDCLLFLEEGVERSCKKACKDFDYCWNQASESGKWVNIRGNRPIDASVNQVNSLGNQVATASNFNLQWLKLVDA